MKAIERLKRLLKSERGNALFIGVAAMPLLFGSAGFAVDTIQLSLMKRQLQRAADSGAMAGAYALMQASDAATAVDNDLRQHPLPGLTAPESVNVGSHAGHSKAVKVVLTSAKPLAFMKIFTGSDTTITAEATAAVVQTGRFCILSLYNGKDAGIEAGGNAQLDLGCGLATNAQGDTAVRAYGSSMVIATPIMAMGGIQGSSNFKEPTVLQPYSSEQSDPFASVPNPPALSGCRDLVVGVQGLQRRDPPITPATECYNKITIKGPVTLPSGTYFVNGGDIDFGAQANVTGTGVTFVMTGPGGAAGDLKVVGDTTMNLTPTTTGDYANMLFYRDRRANSMQIKINGNASTVLSGAFYFPTSDVTFNGNAGMKVNCFQLVGQKVNFIGNAAIANRCTRPGGGQAGFEMQMVRLVG